MVYTTHKHGFCRRWFIGFTWDLHGSNQWIHDDPRHGNGQTWRLHYSHVAGHILGDAPILWDQSQQFCGRGNLGFFPDFSKKNQGVQKTKGFHWKGQKNYGIHLIDVKTCF